LGNEKLFWGLRLCRIAKGHVVFFFSFLFWGKDSLLVDTT
jgi:hypothetical protein